MEKTLNLKLTEQAMHQSVYLQCDSCGDRCYMANALELAAEAWATGYSLFTHGLVLCHSCYTDEDENS